MGVASLTIHDSSVVQIGDLSGQVRYLADSPHFLP